MHTARDCLLASGCARLKGEIVRHVAGEKDREAVRKAGPERRSWSKNMLASFASREVCLSRGSSRLARDRQRCAPHSEWRLVLTYWLCCRG